MTSHLTRKQRILLHSSHLASLPSENILDNRLIEQFMSRLSGGGADGNQAQLEAAKKQKAKKRKREEEKEANKKKAPSFLMQTASGRMPRMAARFEANSNSNNKGKASSQQPGQSAATKEERKDSDEDDEDDDGKRRQRVVLSPRFERSVRALERDLRMLPATAAGTIQPSSKASSKVKKEEEEEEPDEEDSYELTEWFPPSDAWSCLQRVVVTDVTVDDVTVTMRECKTPEGFFASPMA